MTGLEVIRSQSKKTVMKRMKEKKTVYDLISRNLRHVNIDNQSRMIVATPSVISSSTNVCIVHCKHQFKQNNPNPLDCDAMKLN